MGWMIEYSEADGLVTAVASGEVTTSDVLAQVAAGVDMIRSRDARGAAVDYSNAILQMQIHEIFLLPDLFDELELPRATRIAIVLPADPQNMHKYTFFDDVANNRGFQVKLYWERTRAHAWLTEAPAVVQEEMAPVT